MSPHLERVEDFCVAGLTERTCIAAELDPTSSRIGSLWGRFFDEDAYERPARTTDTRLFGVYTRYEGVRRASFDITAGVAVTTGEQLVRIEGGDYLVFRGRGPMPRVIHSLWEQVDTYFSEHPHLRRRYRSDFEAYSGPAEVALHIGVQRDAFVD